MDASQTMRRLLFAAVAVIVSTEASAQSEQRTAAHHADPIRQLLGCASPMGMMRLDLAYQKATMGDAAAHAELEDGMQAMRKCSGDALPEAVREAGDNAALVEAVKTFYVKDGVYVDSIVYRGSRRVAEHDKEEASSRVIMELKLAGK